jgi:hypothetical protein
VNVLIGVVVVETLILGLLAVVVVALLRSHAEVLRRLPAPDEEAGEHDLGRLQPVTLEPLDGEATMPAHLPGPRGGATQAQDIVGTTLGGDQVVVSMASGVHTLVAFLSTGCLTCRTFWEGLQPAVREPLPGGARVVVVVKDRELESSSKLRDLAPPDVPVVHSSQAWDGFNIAMSPYFCFVDGTTGEVRSEGAAMTWEQVASLLRDALLDEELARREA